MSLLPKDHIAASMQDGLAAREERLRMRLGQSLEQIATISAEEWQAMSDGSREMILSAIEDRGRREGARASRTMSASPPPHKGSRFRQAIMTAWLRLETLPPIRTACLAGLVVSAVAVGAEFGFRALSDGGFGIAIDRQQAETGRCKRLSSVARGCRYRVQKHLSLAQAAQAAELRPDELRDANPAQSWPARAGNVINLPAI